jgi:hypothetical protein
MWWSGHPGAREAAGRQGSVLLKNNALQTYEICSENQAERRMLQ